MVAAQLSPFYKPVGFLLSRPHRLLIAPLFAVILSLSACVCVSVCFNHFASMFLHCTNGINWIEGVTAFVWICFSVYFTERAGGLNSLCFPHKTGNSSWQQCPWLGQTLQQQTQQAAFAGGRPVRDHLLTTALVFYTSSSETSHCEAKRSGCRLTSQLLHGEKREQTSSEMGENGEK